MPWLTLIPASGTTPSTLGVAVNSSAALFKVGTYSGTVSVGGPGMTSQSVSVTLTIYPTPPPPVTVGDFGTNNSFSMSGFRCVSGAATPNCGPAVTRYIAAPFVPGSTFTLSEIALPVSYNSGTNGAVISLMTNSGGLPGAVLESWSVTNLPGAPVVTSVSSKVNPVLQAGQTYWLEVQPLAADTLVVWYTNGLGLAGGITNINQAGWIALSGYGGQTLPAFSVTGITPAPPAISNVQDAESARTSVVPGEWAAIYGTNMAVTSRPWAAGDFTNGNALPTSIDGVSVQFGGVAAAVYFVSATQVDVQVPGGLSGSVPVTVTLNRAQSASFVATVVPSAPSLFVYPVGSLLYAAATHADGSLIGDPAVTPGATKASPGETIVLYVNGLDSSTSGMIISTPVPNANPVVTVGSMNATVTFAGLVAAGEFQVNVRLPAELAAGNDPITVAVGSQVSPANVMLPVE